MGGYCWFKGKEIPCELSKLVRSLSIPTPVVDRSTEICCEVVRRKLVRKRPLDVIAASCSYAACRESNFPVTLREFAAAIRATPEDVGRCYVSIRDQLHLTPPSPNGMAYALKVASRVHASEEATELSVEVERRASAEGFEVRNPMTMAAAAVYLACLTTGYDVRQSDAAEAAGVSVMSMRECAKRMRRFFDLPQG
jgi:transcription initiation factor TFIIB